MKKVVAIVFALVVMASFVGCNKQQPDVMRYEVPVEWTDFIKFDGVSYRGDWQVTEVSADLIGEKIGEVTCGVPTVYTDGAGNTTSMEPEDGASFLCAIGTELFSVTGDDTVVAASVDGKYYLYVSEKHPAGLVGGNLYVIVNGQLYVYERYQPGTGDLTTNSVLGEFNTETEIEGIIWNVYSAEEYPDLSYVLLISGTNASWTYKCKE